MSTFSHSLATTLPWTDRNGRISGLRASCFLILLLPGTAIFADLFFGPLRPEPYEHALHETGEWTIRFLVLCLALTPLRRLFRWNRLAAVRRMTGVASLVYGLLHLLLYMAQENWLAGKIISEIVSRFYLTIGFAALLGLAVLGATSFDAAMRRMGRRWFQLHRLVYPITALGLFHYFLQSKADVSAPTLLTGLFLLLMFYRTAVWARLPLPSLRVLITAAAAATAATAAVEYAWYSLATNFPADRIFLANFNFAMPWRPAIWTGLSGLAIVAIWFGKQTGTRLWARLQKTGRQLPLT